MGKRDVHDKEKPCLEPLTRKRIATVLTVQFDDVTTVRVPIRPVPLRANHPSVPDADENGAVPFGSNTDIETLEGWRIPHRLQPQPQRSIPSIAIFTKKQKVVPRNLTATAASLSATVDVESSSFKDFPTTGIVIEAGTKHRHGKNRLHQERPVRVTSVVDALERHGLLERCKLVSSSSEQAESFLQDEDYLRVHSFGYFERLGKLSTCNCCNRLDQEAEQYQSIFLTPDSVSEAKKAATSLCTLTEQAWAGRTIHHGFAIVRPPGHHAEPGLAGGFCLINNVAVAAAYARAKLDGVQRVLIVDWDVHHGNGTQSIFYQDPSVLYFSVHRYEGENFYPFSKIGSPNVCGAGDGQGYTVNVGWSHRGMGDAEYLAVWEFLLIPMVMEFDPDLVLVSAGFDAAEGDVGECRVTPEGFAKLTRQLKRALRTCAKVTNNTRPAPIVCTLEGGYVLSVLGQCVKAVVETLLEEDFDEDDIFVSLDEVDKKGIDIMDNIHPSAARNILQTMKAQRPFWKCLTARQNTK